MMMKTLNIRVLLPLAALILFSTACFEPDREGYRDMAAEEVCDEMDRCDNLGSDGIYDSYSDCIVEERSRFNSMWPENHCGDGRINADAFDSCMNRARLTACSANILDYINALGECSRSEVCID